jgi:hypothetical protein
MTRTQKTVFILVAIVALIMGLTVNKVLSGKGQGDPTALIDAGIILLPQSRQLPPVTMTNQDGQPVLVNELKGSGACCSSATPSARTSAPPPSPNCVRSRASCLKRLWISCR